DVVVNYDPAALQLVGGALGVDRGRIFTDVTGDSASQHQTVLLGWDRPTLTRTESAASIRFGGHRGGSDHPTLHWVSETIATLRFQALKAGTHVLDFGDVRLFDQDHQGVNAQQTGLTLTVTEK